MLARERIFSPSGERIEKQHGYYAEAGETKFGVVGDINVVEKINASAKGSTLYEMIEKYQRTGDDSFLFAKAQAFDVDLTVAPKSLIELYNLKSTCAQDFYKFPVDFRALFNHNVDDYFKAIQDKTIEDKMKAYFEEKGKSIENPIEKPVVKEEEANG